MADSFVIDAQCQRITCHICGYTSRDPDDVIALYCRFCDTMHGSEKAALMMFHQEERQFKSYVHGIFIGVFAPWVLLILFGLVIALVTGNRGPSMPPCP